MSQDIPIYQFLIFGAKLSLLYYRNFSEEPETVYDYEKLNTDARIMNTIGTAIEMSRVSQAFNPPNSDMVFRSFKTNQYRFSMYQTANELRFIIFSSLSLKDSTNIKDPSQKQDGVDFTKLFQQLFDCYIDSVKRNYLYQQDNVINIPKFKQATNGVFKDIVSKKK